jgi:lysyl-tRNA synthetase class I
VLQAVDDALKSAAEEEKKTSNGADKAFKNAVNMLKNYGRDYHPEEAVAKRMEKAEEDDKSSLKVLNKLKETFRVREEPTPFASSHTNPGPHCSRWRRNRQRKSNFFSSGLFLIRTPPW